MGGGGGGGLKPVQDDFQHIFAQVTDEANGLVVLVELYVDF